MFWLNKDAAVKRAVFIRSSCEIREVFKHSAPQELLKALKVYSSSFYGSSLWDLSGDKANQVYNAWIYTVKLVWGCPPWTILCRFFTFFNSLRNNASSEVRVLVRFLARDVQSVTRVIYFTFRNVQKSTLGALVTLGWKMHWLPQNWLRFQS